MVELLQQLLAHGGYFDEGLDFVRLERVQVGSWVGGGERGRRVHRRASFSALGVKLPCWAGGQLCFKRQSRCMTVSRQGVLSIFRRVHLITIAKLFMHISALIWRRAQPSHIQAPTFPCLHTHPRDFVQIVGTLVPSSFGRANLSSRLLSRVRVAAMAYPDATELAAVCTQLVREVGGSMHTFVNV